MQPEACRWVKNVLCSTAVVLKVTCRTQLLCGCNLWGINMLQNIYFLWHYYAPQRQRECIKRCPAGWSVLEQVARNVKIPFYMYRQLRWWKFDGNFYRFFNMCMILSLITKITLCCYSSQPPPLPATVLHKTAERQTNIRCKHSIVARFHKNNLASRL